MISEFGEERILCCSCDSIIKDTSVIQSETTNLQQRVNSLTQEVRSCAEEQHSQLSGQERSHRTLENRTEMVPVGGEHSLEPITKGFGAAGPQLGL